MENRLLSDKDALKNINYFKIFSLEEKFDLDVDALENAYLKLQKKFHPDKFTNASQEDKQLATENTSLINQAYAALISPIDRACYMIRSKESCNHDRCKACSIELLEKQFELRDEVDSVEDMEQLKIISKKVAELNQDVIDRLSKEFVKDNVICQLKELEHELLFVDKLKREIKRKKI